MAVLTTPGPDPFHKPAKAFPYRLALDDPESTARLHPIVGKSEKVETTRVFRRFLSKGRPIEIDQRRLFGMNGQVETIESLRQNFHDPDGVLFQFESDDEVIRKSN